jgi:uncharacterized membrane protein YjjP (DUF1212 family)
LLKLYKEVINTKNKNIIIRTLFFFLLSISKLIFSSKNIKNKEETNACGIVMPIFPNKKLL